MKIKGAIRSLTPPILWNLAHSCKSLSVDKNDAPFQGFSGPFRSWEEAAQNSDGWDAAVITSKTLDVSLKLRDGQVEYQQDTVIYKSIRYSSTIVAFLLLSLERHKDKLNLVDFGGSLGTNYYQNRKLLRQLTQTPVAWNIVELPVIAKLGAEHFAEANLRFFSSLDQLESQLGVVPPAFLFSGSLQCLPTPFAVLDRVIQLGASILAFDRLLVGSSDSDAILIQHPNPEKYFDASCPVWRFSKKRFIENLAVKGFSLVDLFTNRPNASMDHCGLLFVRNSTFGAANR
jgi:putative methyltransferase (TIGR04325 family)